jgi:hypothetical protein
MVRVDPIPTLSNCRSCLYFRQAEKARWKKYFCHLTGESVTEAWRCIDWTPAKQGGGV